MVNVLNLLRIPGAPLGLIQGVDARISTVVVLALLVAAFYGLRHGSQTAKRIQGRTLGIMNPLAHRLDVHHRVISDGNPTMTATDVPTVCKSDKLAGEDVV